MQTVLAILSITGACAYLGWQVYQRFYKKDSTCDGCSMGKTQQP